MAQQTLTSPLPKRRATAPLRGPSNQPDNLMDRIYRHQRFIYDASRKYYLLGRDEMIEALAPPAGGTVLELGCGTGRNLIHAAERYGSCSFYGVDISNEMLKTATRSIQRHKLTGQITLAAGDATAINPADIFMIDSFDRVFISFSLSMIPAWPQVLAHAQTLTKPGGEIHIVDFGNCAGLPRAFKGLLYWWLARFHVHPIPAMETRLQYAAEQAGNSIKVTPLHKGYSLRAVIGKPHLQNAD